MEKETVRQGRQTMTEIVQRGKLKPTRGKRGPPSAKQLAALEHMPPTEEHRLLVRTCSGVKMTADEIRCLIINPRTDQPISRDVLFKYFRWELDNGFENMKAKLARAFDRLVDKDHWPAVERGLRQYHGWRDDPAIAINAQSD